MSHRKGSRVQQQIGTALDAAIESLARRCAALSLVW
jgi:hypothetical protein